jgi:hypothetical protein
MKISVLVNTHECDIFLDTIDSIRTYVSNDILTVVDAKNWDSWGENLPQDINAIKGFYHGYNKAPYKNYTYGLKKIYEKYPDSDWYCYCEPDVIFASDKFKKVLSEDDSVWMYGNDLRYYDKIKFPFLENMLNIKFNITSYFLGCCLFFNKIFIKKLNEINFFDTFLKEVSIFKNGYFPDCDEQNVYDIGENLYPTLAFHLGGKLKQFACWNQTFNHWTGNFKEYPMRWRPELTFEDNYPEACILHPVKNTSGLRQFHKTLRKRKNVAKYV